MLDVNAETDACRLFVVYFSSCFSHVRVNDACVVVTSLSLSIICRCRHVHQPSEGSIRGDKAALCLHTEFNHGSPHLHRPGWEAVCCESQSLWRWRWKEIWREEDSKKQSFVNRRGGKKHMSLGKLSEGEIAFQSFPGMVHHHIVHHKIMGNNASSCCDSANLSLA